MDLEVLRRNGHAEQRLLIRTDGDGVQFRDDGSEDLIVNRVKPGRNAAIDGLRPDDIILSINGRSGQFRPTSSSSETRLWRSIWIEAWDTCRGRSNRSDPSQRDRSRSRDRPPAVGIAESAGAEKRELIERIVEKLRKQRREAEELARRRRRSFSSQSA